MLSKDKKESIMCEAITKYGIVKQQAVAMEEMGELIQQIAKMIRGDGNIINLVEEMADVYIMLEEIKQIYTISDKELEDEMNFKLVRLNERMKEEE